MSRLCIGTARELSAFLRSLLWGSLMRMGAARTVLRSFPVDTAPGLGKGKVHEVKGRIPSSLEPPARGVRAELSPNLCKGSESTFLLPLAPR